MDLKRRTLPEKVSHLWMKQCWGARDAFVLPFFCPIGFWTLAVLVCIGCYNPQRDLSTDPFNNPVIHLLDASYDASVGSAVIKWEYIGQKPVDAFLVQRRQGALFVTLSRVAASEPHAGYISLGTFQDRELFAGELLEYRVVAEQVDGGAVNTSARAVAIPGAGLREIRRDPVGLAVQLVWEQASNGVSRYEVERTVSGLAPEIIFVTEDVQQTSFWDRQILSNRPHTYLVRSRLNSGTDLKSRSLSAQFYREGGRNLVETLQTSAERMRLASGDRVLDIDLLALVGRLSQLSLFQFRYVVGVDLSGIPRVLRTLVGISFPDLVGIMPGSVDIAGPSLVGPRVVFPRAYFGGLDASGRVSVIGVSLAQNSVVWQMPDDWISASSSVRITQDEQQHVYVASNGEMRVYSPFGFQVGKVPLSGLHLVDLAVQNNVLWAAYEDRLQRGMVQFSGGVLLDVVWEDVSIDGITQIQALTLNASGQALVLGNGQLSVLNTKGVSLLSWDVPEGVFSFSDLAVGASGGNLLHVSEDQGEVITYVP